ncbi:hypothetical protein GCM10011390_35510 [Aureimonas endophytica]|uniref:Copper(I)-binding protein n=2 Tax=Aureimonas endophytica TaxID=2027858 RepID=A0A916ZTM3_9HYPH|nr:hypothetical protein GCM10011390_35510 [Aureimonas endophytica]
MRTASALLAGLVLLTAVPASADDSPLPAMGSAFRPVEAGAIRVESGSVTAMRQGEEEGRGLLTIANRGTTPDRITSVSSPSAAETRLVGPEDAAEIPAQGRLTMRTDGAHLVFSHVAEPFRAGGEIAVTVTFETAGPIGLRLPVVGN